MKAFLSLLLLAALCGCSTRHAVLVNTATMLGFTLTENPASGMYETKFGYARSEFAYVPSNRAGKTNETNYAGGAKDTANVLMELEFNSILSKSGRLYQRLAVGDEAVKQSALMFAKNADGTLDPAAANALAAAKGIPAADTSSTSAKVPMAKTYQAAPQSEKAKFDAVAVANGFSSFATFLANPQVDIVTVLQIRNALLSAGIQIP